MLLFGLPTAVGGAIIGIDAEKKQTDFSHEDLVRTLAENRYSAVEVSFCTVENYDSPHKLLRFSGGYFPDYVPSFTGYVLETKYSASGGQTRDFQYTQSNKYQASGVRLEGNEYQELMYEHELRNLLTAHTRAEEIRKRVPDIDVRIGLLPGVSQEDFELKLEEARLLGLEPFPMYLSQNSEVTAEATLESEEVMQTAMSDVDDMEPDYNFVGSYPKV